MEAGEFKTADTGKRIAGTKRVFTWTFKLFGQDYSLSLTVSYKSKKYLVRLNNEIDLFRARRNNEKEPFKYEFCLDNELFTVTEKEKRADLFFKDKNFHNYLKHSVLLATQQPIIKQPQIILLPIKPAPKPDPKEEVFSKPTPIPSNFAKENHYPNPSEYGPPPAVFQTNNSQPNHSFLPAIKIEQTTFFETSADVFREIDFPVNSDQTELVFRMVYGGIQV